MPQNLPFVLENNNNNRNQPEPGMTHKKQTQPNGVLATSCSAVVVCSLPKAPSSFRVTGYPSM
jgi:hypothetical protein